MRITAVRKGLGLACLVALVTAASARAVDELIPGDVHVVQALSSAKMVAKPIVGVFDLPIGDPRNEGATLQIFDTGGGSPPMSADLPASGWKGLGRPAGSGGYSYRGAGTVADPCTSVIVKPAGIKFDCQGSGVTLDPPFTGNSAIILTVGVGTRYCAEFGGTTVKNTDTLLRRKNAPAPAACGTPPSSTTSTSSTSSTSTSSTSSSTVPPATTSTSTSSTTSSTAPPATTSTSTSSTTSSTAPPATTSTSSSSTTSTSRTTTSTSTSSTSTSSSSSTSTSRTTTSTSTSSTSTSSSSSTSTSRTTTSTSTSSTSTSSSSSTSTSRTTTSTSTSSTSSTSTSSSSTSTSSTTSSTVPLCCNGAAAVSFLNVDSTGDCGDIITAGTTPTVTNLVCSGLYTGGGGNSVPLPFAVPDNSFAISRITACTGQTGTLGGTTSTQTGSNRTCTSTGCLFGAPLAVPNASSTPTSVCVINAASTTASGTVVCNTGVTTLSLPLSSTIYLTGDKQAAQAGIQPCPTCRGGTCTIGGASCNTSPECGANGPCVGQTCFGGPNNGMACAPGTNIGPSTGDLSYPTTHDCPPDGSDSIGSLPVAFLLNTGTVTWTGTPATNDTGSTASTQTRVFSGFCRDVALPGGTGSFDSSATAGGQFQQCWENGMAAGATCSEALNDAESCEQRTQGAFGPNGGAIRTIQAIGNAMSLLGGPAPGTLVSIFSIPPTFDATIDSAGDLPGPGAVSIVGTANLCSALNCM